MTKVGMLAKLILGASIAVPSFCHAATGRDKSGEFCLVSPSAVDVERSSRTSGSISMLGGVFGGGSVDRDVTDRRTTNISDDSLKTKREQYAIECRLATEAAKTDEERRVIAQTLFRRWFPELAPKDSTIEATQETRALVPPNTPSDAPGLFQPTPKGEGAKTSSVVNVTSNQPTQNRVDEPMAGSIFNVSSAPPSIQSYVRDDPNASLQDLERQIELVKFTNVQKEQVAPYSRLFLLDRYDYSCSLNNEFNSVSLINIPPYEFNRQSNKLNSGRHVPTAFFISVMIFDQTNSVTTDKYSKQLTLRPDQETHKFSYQYGAKIFNENGRFEGKSLNCLVLIFKKID